jgi:hypothetical protein
MLEDENAQRSAPVSFRPREIAIGRQRAQTAAPEDLSARGTQRQRAFGLFSTAGSSARQ